MKLSAVSNKPVPEWIANFKICFTEDAQISDFNWISTRFLELLLTRRLAMLFSH